MRIRTIKPEFFKDDKLAELPFPARLLFVGLWCMADRRGRLEDRPKRIQAELLPYDSTKVDVLLDTLHAGGFIIRYEVNGVRVIQVRTFEKHQRINGKESATESEYPEPNGEVLVKQQGSTGEAPETTGREGKGKEGKDESPLLPLPFPSDAFKEAWTDFQRHRSEIHHPLKPTSTKLALKELEVMGESRAVIALRHTVAKGWQGIREPDSKSNGRPDPKDDPRNQIVFS